MEIEQAKIGTAVPAVRDISDLENRRIYQVIPFVNAEEEEELLRRMSHCRTKRWGDAVVDLMSRTGGKENGIRALCAAIGITPEETIAFGDAAAGRYRCGYGQCPAAGARLCRYGHRHRGK